MAVTHLSGLMVNPTITDIKNGNFFSFPQLTQNEIDSILVNNLTHGTVIYNTDSNVYMCYIDGSWNNLNSSLNYKGEGYSAGSPFAIPSGARSLIEVNPNNQISGVLYSDTENAGQPRIYINGGWQDVAVAGGGSPTYTNLTVTDTTTTNNLNVTNSTVTDKLEVTSPQFTAQDLTLSADLTVQDINSQTIQNNASIETNTLIVDTSVNIAGVVISAQGIGGITNGAPFNLTAVAQVGAGVGATATLFGSDMSGTVTLVVGSSPTAGSNIILFTLTDSSLYSANFGISITPANNESALLPQIYTTVTQTSSTGIPAEFVLALATGHNLSFPATYIWNYLIMGNQGD